MPTYQYVCTDPDDRHEFEVVQSFSDPSVTECPQCGSPVRKVYGSVGVVFKGSGFYRTDSRAGSSSGSSDGSAEKKEPGGEKSAASTAKPPESSASGNSTSSSTTASSAVKAAD